LAPEPLKELLGRVEPGRRDFLKSVVTGTAFAVPLLQSFSMDGLAPEAEAVTISNQSCLVSNVRTTGGQPYDGPGKFKAALRDGNNRVRGSVILRVADDCSTLITRLTVAGQLVIRQSGGVFMPAAEITNVTIPNGASRLVLTRGIGVVPIAGVLRSGQMLEDLAAGLGVATATSDRFGALQGPIVPL